jgi:hypothetical protein
MAPSIATQTPHPRVSERYSHIKTIDLLEPLMERGWYPHRAVQQPVRSSDRDGYQKHVVYLRHEKLSQIGEFKHRPEEHKCDEDVSFFELRMTNSHDRTTRWDFVAGIFRMICANGLVVSTNTFSRQSLTHLNLNPKEVISMCDNAANRVEGVIGKVHEMREIQLTERQRLDFAEFGLRVKYCDNMMLAPVGPEVILTPRRGVDESKDLWTTYNVIQENLIKALQRDGNRRDIYGRNYGVSNPVVSLQRDLEINQSLWDHAAQFLNN